MTSKDEKRQADHLRRVCGERHERVLSVSREHINEERRTVELAFSSELPYERWWGIEVLDHAAESVRLGRLADRAALLLEHDTGKQVGVVESVTLGEDRVGRAVVRFGRSALAEEIWQDVVDGIREKVSVGYTIHRAVLEEERDDGPDVYRVADWEPHEISIVAVPADASVGVGRSTAAQVDEQTIEQITDTQEDRPVTEKKNEGAPEVRVKDNAPAPVAAPSAEDVRKAELSRIENIEALGDQFEATHEGSREMARKAIRDGVSLDAFRGEMLKHVGSVAPKVAPELGMDEKEVRQYSLINAINYQLNPQSRAARDAAAFEIEVSDALSDKTGQEFRGIGIPMDVLRDKRDLTVGTATAGGHTVGTNLLGGSFIDVLDKASLVLQRGTVLRDLVGNIAIPRQTSGATAYWVAESGAPTESAAAFDQVTMSPKTVAGFSDISRKLLQQSSIDIEGFVRRDLGKRLALAIDLAALHGSGTSNQPTGVASTSGIGSVAGGTNGAAPDWDDVVDLESAVSVDNALMGDLAYVTNAAVAGKLKKTAKVSSTDSRMILDGSVAGGLEMNGYPVFVTNQVSSTLTKGTSSGVCSAIFFGNWSDLLVGFWGGLDLLSDPYTASSSGTVRVTAFQDIDLAVRHAESFSAMLDALTA